MSYLDVFRLQGRSRDVRKDNHAPQTAAEPNTAWMLTSRANGVCVTPSLLPPEQLLGSGLNPVPLGPEQCFLLGVILFPRYSFIYV